MGLEFDQKGTKQATIHRDNIKLGLEMCCLQVLLLWMKEGGAVGKPVNWGSIVTCLQDMDMGAVVKDVREALNVTDDEIDSGPTPNLSFPDAVTPAPANRYKLKLEVEKEIRDYQWELALPGLSGQNYIVSAPTGSGKTRVAGLVISEHLIRMKGRGKVMFLVNKVPLVQQQRKALQEMLHGAKLQEVSGDVATCKKAMLSPQGKGTEQCQPGRDKDRSSSCEGSDHLSISQQGTPPTEASLEGGAKQGPDSAEEIPAGVRFSFDNDIIVCTAGCLVNELECGKMSLSDVSLVVIDECHNTRKNSDYARIMAMYVRAKLSGEKTLPQVMGLTATPGAGDSARPTVNTVLEHLLAFCAAMDATGGIHMVRENISELKLHQTSAKSSMTVLEGRDESEPFIIRIVGIMAQLEGSYKMKPPSESKWSQTYTVWVSGELAKAEGAGNRDLGSVLRTLKSLSATLKAYSNLSFDDAMEVLSSLAYPSESKATDTEKELSKAIVQLTQKLRSLERVENPMLLQVEDIVHEKFESSPESKAVIFVETKFEVTCIDRWIKTRPRLSAIRSDVMTGQTRDTGKTMTKAEQSASLSGFRGMNCNLLVSTSVLEEGIDVPACNLVIRYQKVTSEIAQVQSKGRARAKDSDSITIVSCESGKQFQEILNEEKVLLVEEVLKMLPIGENLCAKVIAKQRESLKQNDQRKKEDDRKYLYNPAEVDIHCRGCSAFLCNAVHVHTIPSTLHFVVVDDGFLSKVDVKVHLKPSHEPHGLSRTHKLYCKTCEVRPLGVMGKWWRHPVEYPVLKCADIKFKTNGMYFQYKQWKKVPFKVSPLD